MNMKPRKTDPYGRRQWCMGNDKDFICFDWCGPDSNDTITLHAVICSESAGFTTEDLDKDYVPLYDAGNRAKAMVDAAWEWLIENKVRVTEEDIKKSEAAADEFIDLIRIEPYVDRRPV
jgi:hypothetical protein